MNVYKTSFLKFPQKDEMENIMLETDAFSDYEDNINDNEDADTAKNDYVH